VRILLDESLRWPLAEQNLGALPIAAVVLGASANRIESLRPLTPSLLRTLETLAPRQLIQIRV